MSGFTSTTLDDKAAIGFAVNNQQPDKYPVLMHIQYQGCFNYFNLNDDKFSEYCQTEKEILL